MSMRCVHHILVGLLHSEASLGLTCDQQETELGFFVHAHVHAKLNYLLWHLQVR